MMMTLRASDTYEPAGSKVHRGLVTKCFKMLIKWVGGTLNEALISTL